MHTHTHTFIIRAGSFGSLEAAVAAAAAASREAPPEDAVDSVLREALQRGGADRLSGAHTPRARRRTPARPEPSSRAAAALPRATRSHAAACAATRTTHQC
jgi:hypothetical protein